MFGRKKRASSQPPQSRNYNAQQGATSAAAIAFLTGQPQGGGGGNLSSAAAAAALRSQTATPTPIGEIQTKRMARRGSTSSFGSNAGSVARQPFGGLQRAPSRGSMTERSFRSPSPGGRNRISSISSDIPPLPTHNRGGSLEGPYRVSSPEPARGARSMSVDRATRTSAQPRRVAAVPRPSLANVPEEGRDPEDYDSFNRQSSINYSRPMSPTGSVSSYRSASARPASASGYYYDPATRKLVGKPPATASPAVKAARASAQQAFVPPPLPASYTAARTRPASIANKPPPPANGPAATLTPAQLRAQHMRAGPPISVSTPVNRPRASSSATASTQATRPGSALGAARISAAQPARPGSSMGLSSTTQINRPGSSMGRIQTGAINSNTSLASFKPTTNNKVAMKNTTASSMGRQQPNAINSNASLASYRPTVDTNTATTRTTTSITQQKPVSSPPSSMSAVQQLLQQVPQSPLQQPKQVRTEDAVTVPSPTQETMHAFHTRAAAMIAGSGVEKAAGGPVTAQIPVASQKESTAVNGIQRDRSTSLTTPSLSTNGVGRTQSVSPSRTTRFASANLSPNTVHEPAPRSRSPAKSAMKPSSIRTLSPAGSIKHSDTDSKSLVSEDGSASMRKKKSVRISLTEDQIPSVPQARNVSAPLTQKGAWTVTDDTDMGSRPALPTFGSVRARNKNAKDGMPMGQRPLSNVYETDRSSYLEDEEADERSVSTATHPASNESSTAVVNGLGLNGVTSKMPAFMRNLPGFSANTPTLSNDIASTTESKSVPEHVPAIAVMPATPRVDEMPEEPRLETFPEHAGTFPEKSEHATIDHDDGFRVEENVAPTAPRQTFLSDFVRGLRPTSEVYDDRAQDMEDVSDIHTPNAHSSQLPASQHYNSETHVSETGVRSANIQDGLHAEEDFVNNEPTAVPAQQASNTLEDSSTQPPRVFWPVGVPDSAASTQHETINGESKFSDTSRGLEDGHVSDLERTISNQERRPQAVRLDTNPIPFDAGSTEAVEPVADMDDWEHIRASWGPNIHKVIPEQHGVASNQGNSATTAYASPPLSPAIKLDHPAYTSPPRVPAATLESVTGVAATSEIKAHTEEELEDHGMQPDDEDWDRVRAYWSSLSERRKQQLEQEASGPVPSANPVLSSAPAMDERNAPEAPLPPWPDHQYQQSVIRSAAKQLPIEQVDHGSSRAPDPFPTPAGEAVPEILREEEPVQSQVEPHVPTALRGYDSLQPQVGQMMPRTMREQDLAQRQVEQAMPRTMRGPDAGPYRQMSNQGQSRGDRPPMMRPASSSGPPPSGRPPMMRPGSSSGPPPSGSMIRPESAAGSVGGRTGSAAANYPLKSALKKTNAPIVIAPNALQRNLSNDSDSDDSFRQNRMRRKEPNASAQGGRYSMRRSMRDSSAPNDRVMSPAPSNGPGKMSMRSSMRDQDAPTLRNGPPGGRGGPNRASLRQQPPQPAQKSSSAPNMFRNRRADSSDEEDSRPAFGKFRSRFNDSDDEDFVSPPKASKQRMFSPGRNSSFGGRGNMSAINESPAMTNGTPQGAALSAGTLRGGGADVTPNKTKRATFSSGTKQDSYDGYSASAPTTPARPGLSERTSSLMRSMSMSTPTGTRVFANSQDYPPPPAIPEQYLESGGTATDKKGNTAEEIARKMWEKQQKSGKSQLPIVSQRTGKKKKFQGLRRMLGIDD